MIRTNEVVVDDPPVVPDDHYMPGFNVAPEEVDYDAETMPVAGPPGPYTDLTFMSDFDDPEPLSEHSPNSTYAWGTRQGNLLDGMSDENLLEYTDVEQGAIGDCYLVAALSSVLFADEDFTIRDGLIREVQNADGEVTHFAVRLYDAWGAPQDVLVDGQIMRRNGSPLYARSMDSDSSGEEWGISLIEKAYAQWHGGYPKVGDGGWAGDAIQAFTGGTATYRPIARLSDTSVLNSITSALEEGRGVVAGTWGKDDDVDYSGTGVYAWHAYSVLGARKDEDDVIQVTLRNPWGSSEPAGNGEDDGIFDLNITEFRKLYQGLTYGGNYSPDVTAPSKIDDLNFQLSGETVTLNFTSPGDDNRRGLVASYDIRVSDKPFDAVSFYDGDSVSPLPSPQSPNRRESLSLTFPELSEGQTLYLAIRAEDEAGNLGPVSDVLTIVPENLLVDVVDPGRFDFEAADQQWSSTGLFHRANFYASSGNWHYWMGSADSADYDVGDNPSGTLTSPAIDLSDASSADLSWQQLLDVESSSSRDFAVVEVATVSGGGDNFETVWDKEFTSEDYRSVSVSLDDYTGEAVYIRFRFEAGSSAGNTGLGWFIDEVEISVD